MTTRVGVVADTHCPEFLERLPDRLPVAFRGVDLILHAGDINQSSTLDALEQDHAFLLEGGVFTQDVIDTWIEYKRTKEIDELRLRPHPYEFWLTYDV